MVRERNHFGRIDMKILVAAILSLVGVNTIANGDPYRKVCWDGSFAYNNFLVQEVENGFEFSMGGATLGNIVLSDYNGTKFETEHWSRARFHFKFKKESCTIAVDSFKCLSVVPENRDQELFVERNVVDITDWIEVISPFSVTKLQFQYIKDDSATLTIGGGYDRDPTKPDQVATFKISHFPEFYHCDSVHTPNLVKFPQRLREHLNK